MQLSRKALNARWGWTSLAAIALLVLLNVISSGLKARTGFDTVDLQGVGTGWGIRVILDHWTSPPDAALAGFTLGLDYLFIPLYAAALFYGSIVAVDRFAPDAGRRRRIMTLLALAPIGAAICDACENGLELFMFLQSPTDTLASLALEATAAKYAGIGVGAIMTVVGLIGRLWKGR